MIMKTVQISTAIIISFCELKLCASAAASEFRQWVQVGIDVYIPHCKYQIKPLSSAWFSVACAAAIVYRIRNHFFLFLPTE